MSNFFTDTLSKDSRFSSVDGVRDTDLLEPVTRQAVAAIIADAAALGIHLIVTETYRSKERQQHLFSTGASKLREVGVHHYGLACDFAKVVNGKANWDGDWKFLGVLAEKHGLIWGGDWGEPNKPHTFRDYDHVQRVTKLDQNKLFAGTWYPETTYCPPIDHSS